ncbi:MAG TPA: hypothetical protein VN667_19065, partial [Burkholderiales bacterium]|nr:hypothetical protein [Burkholderiales bacterium]
MMVVLAAACLLFVLRRQDWLFNLLLTAGIGAWGWAIAAPFLSPSLMHAIRAASAASDGEGWSLGSFTAIALVILGWAILWQGFRRWTDDWRIQFFVLFAWLTSSIPLLQLALQ